MTTPNYSTPRDPSAMDSVLYAKRVADAILRNNPLTDATVNRGLIKWLGNYANGGGTGPDKINFLWIGEFLPPDTNLPGSPGQRGFSLVRDDSRGGVSAIAMYDPSPSSGGALKQALFFTSGDGKRLAEESRDGGWKYPHQQVPMGYIGGNALDWIGTTSAAPTFATIAEGRFSVLSNRLAYRVFCSVDSGATGGNYRIELESEAGTFHTGTVHSLGAGPTSTVFDDFIDVTAFRGQSMIVRWQANRVGGANSVRSSVLTMRNFTL